MAKKGEYSIGDIYQGGYSSLDPNKGYGNVFTGYHVAASELGAPTKPDTANQIQQINMLLNQGIIPIEVGTLQPEIFDQIPKQHFEEMRRMAKLAGAKLSVHAPLVEPSGIGEQGWSETNRELAERQLNNVIEKTANMTDKEGMSITIHSSGLPGTEYMMTKDGKKKEKIIIVDRETGKPVHAVEEEKVFYPGKRFEEEGTPMSPEKRVDSINHTQWDNSISQLFFNKERADEILQHNLTRVGEKLYHEIHEGNVNPVDLDPIQKQALSHVNNASMYLEDLYQNVDSLFNKAYKNGSEEQKSELKNFSNEFAEEVKKNPTLVGQSNAINNLLARLKQPEMTPQLYQPIEDFALEKSSKTFANVAFNAFEKFKDKNKIPSINIENLYTGMAFSSMEDMDKLITASRKEFVKKAEEKGMSKSAAEKYAEQIIGMTLDVGHLNISKKKGFKDEDLRKEVEQIAKHVKHVHITDNFGYSDSHLPPGMGNVPFKEILTELEKAGFKGNKIGEFGGWVQHFGTSPYPIALEAMGSPIYSMRMAPYWNQSMGLQQGYMGGYGMMLPQINYQTFGAGFSQLPMDLGGQMPGAQGGRMSGTPME